MAFADLKTVHLTPKRADKTGAVRALHLSDLHFTTATFSGDRDAAGFRDRFFSVVKTCGKDYPFDLIFVTGDVVDNTEMTRKSHESVLKQAKDLLVKLCKALDIDPLKGLIVIPGNHDMKWKGIISRKRTAEDFKNYFEGFDEHRYFPDLDLLVGCFDSSDTCDWGELATGLVDLRSIDRLIDQVAKLPSRPSRCIALVHHHPLPVPASEFLERNRLIGRTAANAPEFMLMRNGGRLIQRLLNAKFQLVLHGHLHCRNYWGPVYGVGGGENWLEVVSGVSLCKDRENRHGFGIMTIGEDNAIEYQECRFDSQGSSLEVHAVPMVPYRIGRERVAREAAQGASFRCDRHHKIVNVVQPDGDIFTSEVYYGFRNILDKPQPIFEFPAKSSALTRQELNAAVAGQQDRVTVDCKEVLDAK